MLLLAACEDKQGPPPRPPEVPIEDNPPPPDPSLQPEPPAGEPAAGTGPTRLHGSIAVGGAPGNAKLTAEQCQKVLDRFIDLVALQQGLSQNDLDKARPYFRMTIAADPNYRKAQEACLAQNNQAQYDCAMMATTLTGWQSCLK
jgi:hypothetical protein